MHRDNHQRIAFWFRRDLRLIDNVGLYHALQENDWVLPVFVFDETILSELEDADDVRVTFIYDTIAELKTALKEKGSDLLVVYGNAQEEWEKIIQEYDLDAVYYNRDYEPYARKRDVEIRAMAHKHNCQLIGHKDQVMFEPGEILTEDGKHYSVYSYYGKKWIERLANYEFSDYRNNYDNLYQKKVGKMPSIGEIGFKRNTDIDIPSSYINEDIIADYGKTRDIPALAHGTTRLGVHLRFGTISIRTLAKKAREAGGDTFAGELAWREFFMQLLWFNPETPKKAFKEKYDDIPWRIGVEAEADFEAWKQGKTGYPIVDAGMRELNATGYMHNRVRMITASFLCKHLLLDWRWGERYFARKLLDYEQSSNVGNWQWAAGSGADAAPYFRIFNPYTQREKHDPNWEYVSKWVPEHDTHEYPNEIVDYKEGRERALNTYKKAVG